MLDLVTLPADPKPKTPRDRRLWRRRVLARVAAGESRAEIAEDLGVHVSTVGRAVMRALGESPPEASAVFVGLQMARVRRALRLAERKIEEGDLNAVHALAKLLPLLERYQDQLRCLSVDPPGVRAIFEV